MPRLDRQSLTAAILVGGKSLRLGRDKALVKVEGVPLAERVRQSVANVAKRVIVVGKTGERNPLPGAPFFADDHPTRCALAGVVAALGAAGRGRVLIVGCDHPFLSAEVLQLICRPGGYSVRVVGSGERLEPLLACWMVGRALPVLTARLNDGALSLAGAIRALDPDVVPTDQVRLVDPELRSLVNINTPNDLTDLGSPPENY